MQTRDTRGRYSTKTKVWFYVLLTLSCLIIAHATYTQSARANEVTVENPTPALPTIVNTAFADVTMEAKVEAKKEEILDTLAKCESAGRKEEDGIVVLDSNDKGSYGPFQFQRTTVMHYYELMTGKPINGRDALILALQGDKARELAKWVIFESDAGVSKDWVNCSRKHNLQLQVDLIKDLEK